MTDADRSAPGKTVDTAVTPDTPSTITPSLAEAAPPGVMRRLACFVYEGVLLFGVVMVAGLAYGGLTQQRHALQGKFGLQLFLFAVLGLYFTWFWCHGGQTLAMKTWHLRVVTVDGQPVSQARAWARYVMSWLWFLPALVAVYTSGSTRTSAVAGALLAGVLAYAGLARLRGDRQFVHDIACATRVVTWRPPAVAKGKAAA
ncbi:RDD family protein [Ideonella sp. A 288]|uniref:RDD family protein n=1 Tax=Ideonella sp. A 288 TaxID=1962181 RepID=UPI000B4AE1F2|nr:RDD family protein [Ideonella sp. A 288]